MHCRFVKGKHNIEIRYSSCEPEHYSLAFVYTCLQSDMVISWEIQAKPELAKPRRGNVFNETCQQAVLLCIVGPAVGDRSKREGTWGELLEKWKGEKMLSVRITDVCNTVFLVWGKKISTLPTSTSGITLTNSELLIILCNMEKNWQLYLSFK